MKEIKNQRGFSTLEMLLVVSIIGIFSTVAVPKMARIVDKVCLDYEMKHLYSDLNFARSLGKSATFKTAIFKDIYDSQQRIEFWIYGKNYNSATAKNRYQIMRPAVTSSPYYRHNLTNGIELDFKHSNIIQQFAFDNQSHYKDLDKVNSKTLTLISKFDHRAEIYFDSVGRWRGKYVK